MTDRDDIIVKAYAVIQKTIRSKGGPCGKLTAYIEGALRMEREDLIQEVATDFCKYYRDDYDETKSALNTYVNNFIRWRLMEYARKHTWDNRKMVKYETSWDGLKEDYGDDVRHSFIARDGGDIYWDLFAELLEEYRKPGWRWDK